VRGVGGGGEGGWTGGAATDEKRGGRMARGKERVRESESGRSVEVYAKNYITCCTPRAAGSPKNASSLSRPFYPTLSSPPALAAPAGPPTQPLRRRVSSAKELSSAKGHPITRHSRSARAEARSARAASPRRRRGVEGGERGGGLAYV